MGIDGMAVADSGVVHWARTNPPLSISNPSF